MRQSESIRCGAHDGEMLAISQQGIDTLTQFIGISHAPRRAGGNRILGCLQEIEGMRP